MSVSVENHLKPYRNPSSLSQGLKLLGISGVIVAGAEHLNKAVNQKATEITAQDYLYSILMGAVIGGSMYGACSMIVPLWQEITEYRPDDSPFLTTSRYLNIHHDRIDDLYS